MKIPNSAREVSRQYQTQQHQQQKIVEKEKKTDDFNADMQSIAKENLAVAKQTKQIAKITLWVAGVSAFVSLLTLIFK